MSETTLLSAYQKAKDQDTDRWLAEMAGSLEKPSQKPVQQQPAQPAGPPREPGEGFFNSVGRAVVAPWGRIKEGIEEMKSAGAVRWEDRQVLPEGTMVTVGTPTMAQRAGVAGMGLLKTVFPFGATAGSLAKAFNAGINAKVSPGGTATTTETKPTARR